MWHYATTILAALVMIGFDITARTLFISANAEGDGGMGSGMLGLGLVLIAGIPAIFLLYKAATFGLD